MVETWVSQSPTSGYMALLPSYRHPPGFLLSCGDPLPPLCSEVNPNHAGCATCFSLILWSGLASGSLRWCLMPLPLKLGWISTKAALGLVPNCVAYWVSGDTVGCRSLAVLLCKWRDFLCSSWAHSLALCLKVETTSSGTRRFVVEMAPLFHLVPTNVVPDFNVSLSVAQCLGREHGLCCLTF